MTNPQSEAPKPETITMTSTCRTAGRGLLLLAVIGGAPVPPSRADDAKMLAYGRHLANECSGCHRTDGRDNGIPSITGWPAAEFTATLAFYRDGARPNAVMVSVAKSLDEDQTRALAAYYATLPKPAASKAPAK